MIKIVQTWDELPPVLYDGEEAFSTRVLEKKARELEVENGRCKAALNDALGSLAGDTCNMCNWLERGDCYVQKEEFRSRLELMWAWMKNESILCRVGSEQELAHISHAQAFTVENPKAAGWFDKEGRVK